MGANLRSESQRSRSFRIEKCENRFSRISLDRFTSTNTIMINGHSIHMSTNTFRQRKCFVFLIICNQQLSGKPCVYPLPQHSFAVIRPVCTTNYSWWSRRGKTERD